MPEPVNAIEWVIAESASVGENPLGTATVLRVEGPLYVDDRATGDVAIVHIAFDPDLLNTLIETLHDSMHRVKAAQS